VFDIGEIIFEEGPDRRRHKSQMKADGTIIIEPAASHSVDAVVIGVKFVIAQFIADEEEDEDTACEADSEAEDIYGGLGFLSFYISECGFKVISQHDKPPVD
jgi:hypothetical protein